ncbi:HTH domain-containing protein [Patescibacteria group bacterium]|nr:HTH domain-containing protein [Patescibacteria group bacterium]
MFSAIWQCKKCSPPTSSGNNTGSGALSAKSKKKQENLAKIEKLLETKSKITNNDVEKMLGVSDATAERYLDQLEKAGKIKQKSAGRSTYYIK